MSAPKNKYIPFIALFLIVFISRFPFLFAGYGIEEDSWGIALAALHTKLTGIYEPSRFPGHPTQELIYSFLWGTGPVLWNLLTAFFSAFATIYFAKILQHFQFKYFFWAALSFAFVPVVFISSTYTIDFMWSEAFVLMSFYYMLKDRFVLAGVLLGLAIGSRVTCGIMLLPYLILLWQKEGLKKTIASMLKITIPMALIAMLVFLPVILQFGSSFFMYYDQFPYPPMSKVFYKMVIGVWGFVGVIALMVALFAAVLRKEKQSRGMLFAASLDKRIVFISFLMIVLYCIAYFRLPQKSGYMLPVIPFVILLFGYYLNARNFKLLCYALIVSSFVCSINLTDKLRGASYSAMAIKFTISGQELFFDLFSGPVFSDHSKRKQKMEYTDEVIKSTTLLTANTVVISGWWYNEIMVTLADQNKNAMVVFEPYIDDVKMKEYISQGYRITYLPEQNVYNDLMFKISTTDDLAKPF